MLVTIINNGWVRELYYGEQALTWVTAEVYKVSQKSMDLISNCEYSKVQSVIKQIMEESEFIKTI